MDEMQQHAALSVALLALRKGDRTTRTVATEALHTADQAGELDYDRIFDIMRDFVWSLIAEQFSKQLLTYDQALGYAKVRYRAGYTDGQASASPTEAPGSEGAGWRYYVDCEFDGHNGALLSIAMVRADGLSIHVETTEVATDPWVIANVVPLMGCNDATTHPLVPLAGVGPQLRDFMRGDPAPFIVADSPVDIGRFCEALMTSGEGGYEPNTWPRMSFEVHDVDFYPTSLPGAVQHNAWWDAMALRDRLALNEQEGE